MKSLLVFMIALPVGASTVYTNHDAWYAATQRATAVFEDFDSQMLIPGLTMRSQGGGAFGVPFGPGFGHVDPANQAWLDCVGKTCDATLGLGDKPYTFTTISYDKPIWGLAGNWKIDDGSGIEITAGVNTVDILTSVKPVDLNLISLPSTAYPQGFVGFTTSQPFMSLDISWGPGAGVNDAYELRSLELVTSNPAPEPETLGFAFIGVAFLALWRLRWKRQLAAHE